MILNYQILKNLDRILYSAEIIYFEIINFLRIHKDQLRHSEEVNFQKALRFLLTTQSDF